MDSVSFDTSPYRELVNRLHQLNQAKQYIRHEVSAEPLMQLCADPDFRSLAVERLGEDAVCELETIHSTRDLKRWSCQVDQKTASGIVLDTSMGPVRSIPGLNFLYAFSGQLQVTLSDNNSFVLSQGQTVIFDLDVPHGVRPLTDDSIPISLILFKPYLNEALGSGKQSYCLFNEFYSRAFYPGNRHRDYLLCDTRDDSHIYYYFSKSLYEFTYKRPFSGDAVDICVSELLVTLMRSYFLFSEKDGSHPLLTDQLQSILDYIDRNLTDVTLSSAAKAFHFSPNHLNRIVKNSTGSTFLDLVHKARMREAGHLLRIPGMTVTEAAHLAGYNNISYFYKLFMRQYHMNPQQYRNTHGMSSEKLQARLQTIEDRPFPPESDQRPQDK